MGDTCRNCRGEKTEIVYPGGLAMAVPCRACNGTGHIPAPKPDPRDARIAELEAALLIGSMYEKSRLLKEKTRALATAEAERLTLARALRTGNGHLDQAASELAARIVAEADAEVRRG